METNNSNSLHPAFLEFLPVSLFGGVMALSALCFSWRQACRQWNMSKEIAEMIGWIALAAFILLSVAYLAKYRRYPASVRQELTHPVAISFFATFIASMLFVPGILLPYLFSAAVGIWTIAAVLMFVFSWYVLRKWLHDPQLPENAVPAWVLPVVGTLDVPLVGIHLKLPAINEVCLFFFGIGTLFSFILITIIISRLLFQKPMPEALQPTLMILIGPFALVCSGYIEFSKTLDIFAEVCFYFDLFLLLLFGGKIAYLPVSCPFKTTWWAVSFPLTAITMASFHFLQYKQDLIHQILTGFLLALSTLVILYLLVQTIARIINGTFSSLSVPALKVSST